MQVRSPDGQGQMENRVYKRVLYGSGLLLFSSIVWAAVAFFRDSQQAYKRIRGKSNLLQSRYGDIEYTDSGSGPPVLVIHGSGGGFDQGELIARAVLDDGFRRICPSRFGYLRSTFRDGATFDDQAHAYAMLLDTLGVEQAAVVAMSHGGPSALLFAALHPERVSSLTLLSAGVVSSSQANQAEANRKGAMLTAIFRHDLLYWSVSKLFKRQLMGLMGADDAVIAGLSGAQKETIWKVIEYMNPASPRSAGVRFDNRAAMPNERISVIRAPTLILHAVDDALQLYHNAEFAAAQIPGSDLIRFEKGGHFLIIVEQDAVRRLTAKHILASMDRVPSGGR